MIPKPAALLAVGGIAFTVGLATDPERAWADMLIVSLLVLGIGLAAAFFIALAYVTGSSWCVALRRVPEAMTPLIVTGSVGVLATLVFGGTYLYPWADPHERGAGFKAVWLNYPFFLARAGVYIALWIAFSRRLVRGSRLQDADGNPGHTVSSTKVSAMFMFVFAITVWLASYDWLMSLDPGFASTIFGVYQFAGLFQSGIAAIIVLSIWLERQGLEFRLTDAQLHDLGKLLFAFSTFWMYIWFSQYMLVWYANLAEEAAYFVSRTKGAWSWVFLLSVVLNWCIPFVVLLGKKPKRNRTALTRVAVLVLAGRYVDLYVAVGPGKSGAGPAFGILEAGLLMGAAGLFWLVFRAALARAALVPVNDPLLKGSLHYHS